MNIGWRTSNDATPREDRPLLLPIINSVTTILESDGVQTLFRHLFALTPIGRRTDAFHESLDLSRRPWQMAAAQVLQNNKSIATLFGCPLTKTLLVIVCTAHCIE